MSEQHFGEALWQILKMTSSAAAALLVTCWPAAVAGQAGSASGILTPAGPPERPPVRVDAGGACVVDLVQRYTMEGSLTGEVTLDYRILVEGPCGAPAGTYDEEWIAHGDYSGTALGRQVTASMLYTARVRPGGSVRGTVSLHGDVQAELDITGGLADRQLSYKGTLKAPEDGSAAPPDARGAPPDSVRGRTVRWTWSEGPTAGVTHEHEFRADGTVRWRVLSGPQEGHAAEEETYEVFEVAETVYAVSYLAASGYTLTVVLNFETGEMFGFASGHDQWFPGRGSFEVVR